MSSKDRDGPVLISREPWWERPPGPGESEWDVAWGFLEYWSDGSFRFVRERPSDEEIKSRKSCRNPA